MDAVPSTTAKMKGGTPVLPFGGPAVPPSRLGRYEDLRPFAGGGMGIVCRAWQREPEREVAVKVLRAGPQATPEHKARFQREIRLAARLEHPGLVPVFDAGEEDGWLYLVMPLLEDAESLVDRAASRHLDWRARLGLLMRAADIVAVLHRQGLLHRDLKPGNILVDRHDEVRVLDFGLAVALDPQGDDLRITQGGIAGTPAYLSPEQAAGRPAHRLTPAVDVYALAVVTYELLTGRMPYEVEANLPELLRAIREARPAPPSSFALDLPPSVERVILGALRKDPAGRPADAGEYAAELRAAIEAGRQEVSPGTRAAARRRAPMGALAAVGLVLLAAGAALATRQALRARATETSPTSAVPAAEAPSPPPALAMGEQRGVEPEPPAVSPSTGSEPAPAAPLPPRPALLNGEAPAGLEATWRAKVEELRSATGSLAGKGALLFHLPPRSRLRLRVGESILLEVDAAMQADGCYHRAPGDTITAELTRRDGTSETWDWIPAAARADTFAPADVPPP